MNLRYLISLVILLLACQSNEIVVPDYQTNLLKIEQDRLSDPALFQTYLNSSDVKIQLAALNTITKLQDTTYIPILTEYSQHENLNLKRQAIIGLGQLFSTKVEKDLVTIYNENQVDSLYPVIAKALTKSVTISSKTTIEDILKNHPYPHVGYDLVALVRRVPEYASLRHQIIADWKGYNESFYPGFHYYFTRLKKQELEKYASFFKTEFKSSQAKDGVEWAIASADILRCLDKIDNNVDPFIKANFKNSANWRIIPRLSGTIKKVEAAKSK